MEQARFLLRAPISTMQKLRELSEEKKRSINSQIVMILEKELKKEGEK